MTSTLHHCPACGYNLKGEDITRLGDWTLSKTFTAYQGRSLVLTPSQHRLLFVIASAHPRVISNEAATMLVAQRPYEVESNVVHVQACRARARLRAQGAPIPFQGLKGAAAGGGWQWIASTEEPS